MSTHTVVVATYGEDRWARLAAERAIPSAEAQAPVVHAHADTLHEARNHGLACVATDRVVFLDADDELEPGYIAALERGVADLRAPAVRYVRNARDRRAAAVPRVAGHTHACDAACLAYGNWLVIGASAPTELLRQVGGFEDWPLYEDWALWARCWLAGATVEVVLAATYRAYVRRDSRNRGPAQDVKHLVHQQIASALGLPVPL